MIHSIYKFMPARIEFFDNFLIRASNKSSLNDPFEARPSFNYWADLCVLTNCDRFGQTRNEIISYLEKQPEGSVWSELGISLYRENGIISFTEERDNLLMWSHYANEHKGIVIEFDNKHDFFHSMLVSENNPAIGKLRRVIYRKSRSDRVGEHLMEPYFHKSEEWAYEKEHRLLLNLYGAHVNLIPLEDREHYESQRYVSVDDITKFSETLLQIKNYYGASIVNESSLMSMFRVPVDAIKSVSFGIKVKESFKKDVKSKLASEELQHIKRYQAQRDKYDYRLRFVEEI